jgi:hypothetical protein
VTDTKEISVGSGSSSIANLPHASEPVRSAFACAWVMAIYVSELCARLKTCA